MDKYVMEDYQVGKYRIDILPDYEPESPREWDNLGEIVYGHTRYVLGDRGFSETEDRAMRRGGFPLLERYLHLFEDAAIVLPISAYIHSGVTIWVGDPITEGYQSFDSGFLGFIATTRTKLREEGLTKEEGERTLRTEVENFDTFLRGDIVGYEIIDTEHDDLVESLYGFYSIDEAKAEAEAMIKAIERENGS